MGKTISKRVRDLQRGDMLVDALDRDVLLVDRVVDARVKNYKVVLGKATEIGRRQYPHDQTSGHKDNTVIVRA